MTDILRYRWTSFGPMLDEDGPFVTYADHVEALRQATALATPETVMQANYWYEQGQRDALAGAVQRVEAIGKVSQAKHEGDPYSWSVGLLDCATVISAIKGDQP
jgi:hypothetical protein